MATLIQPPLSYPGVYVVEVPEGNNTIAGVPTSVTAFIGRTAMGLTDNPVLVTGFGQFSQLFGGLSENYPLTYAVNDFFNNGGTQALIVRLVSTPQTPSPSAWEFGGAASALNYLAQQIPTASSGSSIDPNKGLPSAVTSPDAKTAAAAVASAWTSALAATGTGAKKTTDLAPALALTVLNGYLAPLCMWSPPANTSTLPIAAQTTLLNDAKTIAALVAATPTAAPQITDGEIDDLLAALVLVRGPNTATASLYGPLTLSAAGTATLPTLLGAAYVIGQVWASVANAALVVPTPGSLVSQAQTAAAGLTNDAAAGGNTIVRAATKAAQVSTATAADVEAAMLSALVGLNAASGGSASVAPFTAQQLLYYGASGCASMQIMTTLCGLQGATASNVLLPSAIDTAMTGTAATTAWQAALQTNPVTPQDALDAIKVGLGQSAVAVIEAADPGAWADGGALTVQVSTPNPSPAVLQQMKPYKVDSSNLFAFTVVYQPPGSPNANITTYPYVTMVSGTPWSLDTVLAQQDQYTRVQSMTATATLDTTGPVSLEGGVDSPPLADMDYIGNVDARTGMYALLLADIFNLVCIPWDVYGTDTSVPVWQAAQSLCAAQRAILLVDPPHTWAALLPQAQLPTAVNNFIGGIGGGTAQRNSAVYFPMINEADPLQNEQVRAFPPCGAIAGIIATTDATRGVWKAPAGVNAAFSMIAGPSLVLTDTQNGQLNPLGLNCIRAFSNYGTVVWGDRTMRGATDIEDEYMYLSVRRLALYIEESLRRGLIWAVFEPNDDSLWASLRASVTSFMSGLQSQGAFYSFAVQCDATTTTQANIDAGVVNVVISFAPVKPAEFVVLYFQQTAGTSPASS